MQGNKIFKGLVMALPIVAMVACSSGPSKAEKEAQSNRIYQEQAEADRLEQEVREAQVQAGSVQKQIMSEEEMMREELSALKNEQTVYFDFDRSSINSQYYGVLDQHAAFLVKNFRQSIVIEGHCDQRGTPEYNIALGERRAKAVETYLQNAGVSASQISVVSYGEEKLINNGTTDTAFAENRRGILVYQ
ncbi:MAG: peptidoglycan-associated lipoprotein [Paraglaciecola sp.]|jgi:peptidoglycan-associated lipoprotein